MKNTIRDLIAGVRYPDDPAVMPVVFNGREPRIIGWAKSHSEADACAIRERVSATFCSKAIVEINGEKSEPFFILHS